MRIKKHSAVLVLAFFLFSGILLNSNDAESANWDPRPATGTRNLLIVLTSFADRAFTTTPSQWHTSIFDNTSGVKSVVNYYDDNSLGNLTIAPVTHSQPGNPAGIVSVTLASNHPNCGNSFNYTAETAWLQEALNVIVTNGWVDFSSLDANTDGVFQNEELVVYFIPAGYEAAGSVNIPNIWAHAWGGVPGVDAGGVELHRWAMNGELNDSGSQLPIGTTTHEMGHSIFGLPDLYDLTYTNSGMGIFTLMAVGSYGMLAGGESSGTTPVSLDAWSRQYLGWTAPAEVMGPDTYSFYPALAPENSPLKLVNPDISTSQYFLAENRYNEGWDLGLERWLGTGWGGGILIQHIDISVGTPPSGEAIWGGNDINKYTAGGHQGVMVEEASTEYGSLAGNTSLGHYTHMFYDPNNTAFTDGSAPDSRLYGDASTGLSLTDISAKARIMSAGIDPAAAATPNFFDESGGTGLISVSAASGYAWTASSNDAWITLNPASSGTGSGTVGFSVSENNLDLQRQGTVSVAGQTVTVVQEGMLSVTPASVTAGHGGGSGAVLVNCTPGYAWSASTSDSWISINSGSSGTGPGTVSYSVQPNMNILSRQGTITVAGKTVTVTQGVNNFDNCDTPRAIACLPYTDMADTFSSTDGTDDPYPSCAITSGTVWYIYSATTFHDVTIDTAGSDFDTTLAVYIGMCGQLAEIACNDNTASPPSPQASLTFSANIGNTYYIMVGGANMEIGSLTLSATCAGGDCPSCPGPEHCNNLVRDADETGIDCGGADCAACDTIAPASLISGCVQAPGQLTISGMASDGGGGGVSGVYVSIDGAPGLSATDTSGNGSWSSWSYTTSMPADGTHSVQSIAWDFAQNSETPSDTVMLHLDNTSPTSSIVNPSDGMVITGRSYSVSGMSDDGTGSGVVRVEVSTNGGVTWELTEYSPGTSWSYNWVVGSAGSHNIRSRAADMAGHVEVPGAGVNVTVSATGSTELTHYDWDYWLSGGGCTDCHSTPETFMPTDFRNRPGLCLSCHNAAAPAHDRSLAGFGHSMFASVTSAGLRRPTYGNVTTGEYNNQPFSRLLDGDKVGCVTCHNPMRKTEDMGRVWEPTTTTDNLTYTMLNGGWIQSGIPSPSVYRDTSLWSGPSYIKDRKDYLVDPSEYSFNEYSGTVTFSSAQDPLNYVYVTLGYPYLRASNAANTLCSDCHTQSTHKGAYCLICHASHGTSNAAGIRHVVRTGDRSERMVIFTGYSGVNSFADGDTSYDGICEVCHTQTKYHRRDGTGFADHSGGVNRSGSDCTACHGHSSGFAR